MMEKEKIKELAVGDIIALKKPHPCGSYQWLVLRTGIDFRLQCQICGRQIMLPRSEVERRTKEIIKKSLKKMDAADF